MTKLIKVVLVLSLALLMSVIAISSAKAQEFNMELSTESVLLGNQIMVKFILKDIEGTFEAPDFDSMPIVSGPNTSASIQIINGDKSSTKTYTYYLQPQDLGLYTIAPAYLITEDGTLETTPMSINVQPNPDNIIEKPQSDFNSSFFRMESFPFLDQPSKGKEKSEDNTDKGPKRKPTETPKRKYKRL